MGRRPADRGFAPCASTVRRRAIAPTAAPTRSTRVDPRERVPAQALPSKISTRPRRRCTFAHRPIRRLGMTHLHPPATVLDIAQRLESAGFEAWCVGGAVRDEILGETHLDWDLATSATPDQVRQVFGAKRTIPVGVEFGTVGVLDRAGTMHEVTTFRRDVKTDGRHAVVEFGVSLDDDGV